MAAQRFDGVRRLLRLRSVERDLDDELRFHFDEVVEELMNRGRSRQDAEDEAHRRFGNEEQYRRELEGIDRSAEQKQRWTWRWEALRDAFRYAFRSVRRMPGLTIGIVLVLALGIGANATMFQIVDRLLLRPPEHIVNPDEVFFLETNRFISFIGERVSGRTIAHADLQDMEKVTAFEAVGAIAPRNLTLGEGETAEQVNGAVATGNYFSLIGARPSLGRFFNATDDVRGGERVAVIGHGYWQRQFGGERSVLGEVIDIGAGQYTVIGVAPRGLTDFNLDRVDIWLPLHIAGFDLLGDQWFESRNWWWLQGIVRLKEGVTPERAFAEATSLHRAGRAESIERGNYDKDVRMDPGSLIPANNPNSNSDEAPAVAKWLAGVAIVVLLIACINVANLLLARIVRQQREIGIRLALGVSRARLVGQIVLEGVLLGLLGGAAAVAMTRWGGGAVRRVLLPDVAWEELGTDARVLAVTAGLAFLAGLFSALMPALQASRKQVSDTLRASSGGITRSTMKVRTMLSLAQAALSVILLIGAGLFVRSLSNVRSQSMGFQPDQLVYVQPVSRPGAPGDSALPSPRDAGVERLAALPMVEAAAWTSGLPFRVSMSRDFNVEGLDSLPVLPTGGPYIQTVTADYFKTMGIQLTRGRGFDHTHVFGSEKVMVVNETLARTAWPGADPLGKCVRLGDVGETPCTMVIGIVADMNRRAADHEPTMDYYLPAAQMEEDRDLTSAFGPSGTYITRVRGEESDALRPISTALLGVDPRFRFVDAQPFQTLIDPALRSWTLGATMFSVFGLLALLVAAVGLYSLLSFDVAQRTREIGLRSALGAPLPTLLRMIISRGMRVVAVGVVIGMLAALALAPRMRDLLFEVSPMDPLIYAGVAASLLVVSFTASLVPALRAARVDPNVALRTE